MTIRRPHLLLSLLVTCALIAGCADDDEPQATTGAVSTEMATGPGEERPGRPDNPAAAYAPTGSALGAPRDNTQEILALVEGVTVDSPADLAREIATQLGAGPEEGPTATVAETITGEPATSYIVVTGLPDDSVTGGVITVTMDPDDSAGWTVVESTTTPICARGVNTDGLCL